MSFVNSISCQCDPCPTNLDKYGYKTEWEDPSFVGTQCLWHKHIPGKLGCISPDIVRKRPAIFVQFFKQSFFVSRINLEEWNELEIVESVSSRKNATAFLVTLKKDAFTVGVSQIDFWANRIGAKRK